MFKINVSWPLKFFFFFFIVFFIWFTPWVCVLNLGTLIYFPYASNGKDRFIRVTGPVPGIVSGDWAYNRDIPSFCKQAAVASEDDRFYSHFGIDLENIQKSIKVNERSKKIKRGGSTITQQIVKNAFLSRTKSYLRKAREIEGALLLDLFMSKNSQLIWYFNIIEFAPNIYGIENASRFYFKKKSKDLTPAECLALVTIIPNPKKWNRSLVTKNLTLFFTHRYDTILNNIEHSGLAKQYDINIARKMIFWKNQNNPEPAVQDSVIPESKFIHKEENDLENENDTEENEN